MAEVSKCGTPARLAKSTCSGEWGRGFPMLAASGVELQHPDVFGRFPFRLAIFLPAPGLGRARQLHR